MKLLRYGPVGQEKTGALDADGQVRDLSAHVPELAGAAVSVEALDALRGVDLTGLPVVSDPGRIGSCLAWVPNFFAVGMNYVKHAAELGSPPPEEPVLFSKATSCLSGPYDNIVIPRGSEKTDWEAELGIVIGRRASYVSEADAMGYIAGFCAVNDVSERSFQMDRGGQWIKGKSAPSFGPVGPWLVTPDEIENPQALEIELKVNGEVMQASNTDDMIFSVTKIVSYMSQVMELRPGDLIATGTPSGVGMGHRPQRFLRPGDVVELSIDALGQHRQEAVAAD